MAKDLTSSTIDRQNILNNQYALAEIKKSIGIKCIEFNGKEVLLKEQVAEFFEVTPRTIDNYLAKNDMELRQNGYEVVRGKPLLELKKVIFSMDVHEIDFMNIKKSPQLGIFDFRAFLNLTMLLVESERAKFLRQIILNIVIDTINKKTGGGTKYIKSSLNKELPMYLNANLYAIDIFPQ